MKDRLKQIRKEIKLTQAELANDLGVSFSNIQSYEVGRRIPSDAFIQLVCNKYNVNEDWLRTGSDEMFKPLSKEEEISSIVAKIYTEDDPFRRKLIKIITDLTPEQIETLKDIAKVLANEENLAD